MGSEPCGHPSLATEDSLLLREDARGNEKAKVSERSPFESSLDPGRLYAHARSVEGGICRATQPRALAVLLLAGTKPDFLSVARPGRTVTRLRALQDLVHVRGHGSACTDTDEVHTVRHDVSLRHPARSLWSGDRWTEPSSPGRQPRESSAMLYVQRGLSSCSRPSGAAHRLECSIKVFSVPRYRPGPARTTARPSVRRSATSVPFELYWVGRIRTDPRCTRHSAELGDELLSSSRRFPARSAALVASPVMLPPGRARLGMSPSSTGLIIAHEDDRHRRGRLLGCESGRRTRGQDGIDPQAHQLLDQPWKLLDAAVGESEFDSHVLAVDVSSLA